MLTRLAWNMHGVTGSEGPARQGPRKAGEARHGFETTFPPGGTQPGASAGGLSMRHGNLLWGIVLALLLAPVILALAGF